MAKPHAVNAAAARQVTSWWLRPRTREEFSVVARNESPRMQESSFGKSRKLTTGKDTEQVERLN